MPRSKEHTWKVCSLWYGLHLSSLVYICCWNMVILCFCCRFWHSSLYTHGNMNCLYAFATDVPIFYIQFICTLSAICNTITYLITADEMDQADDELRDTIRNIWPLQAKKMLDLLIPRNEGILRSVFVHVYVLCVQTRLLSSSPVINTEKCRSI